MKRLNLLFVIAALFCFIFSAVSCSMENGLDFKTDWGASGGVNGSLSGDGIADDSSSDVGESASGADDYAAPDSDGFAPGDAATEDTAEGDALSGGEDFSDSDGLPVGLITAKAWNDNDNFEFWLENFEQNEGKIGKFYGLQSSGGWSFELNRIKTTVADGAGNAVAGAKVTFYSSERNGAVSAISNSRGEAYIFTSAASGRLEVSSADSVAQMDVTAEKREYSFVLESPEVKRELIELMFVIDVTGSMGDELAYLQNELSDVIARVAFANPNVQIELALLFYRDLPDGVPFSYYDFVTVSDSEGMAEQSGVLLTEKASGGGDYPEAVDEALKQAVEKQWSEGASTKLIFHLLDAPPHSEDANRNIFSGAVKIAAEKGIRICPILCSGADTLTEFVMRQAAIQTGGTSIFVTDDSGIGGSHLDPSLPNATVEALNEMLIRLINGYYTGEFAPAVAAKGADGQ